MRSFLKYFLILLFVAISVLSFPQLAYKNTGTSQSVGSVSSGTLINAYKLPYRGENFSFFSPFSYFILGRAYVHSSVYKTLINSYKKTEKDCSGIQFKFMECSNKKGGKMYPHQTHQNGLSIDFMTPLVKNGEPHMLLYY